MAEIGNTEGLVKPEQKPDLFKKAIKHLVFASLALAGCGPVEGKNIEEEVVKALSVSTPVTESMGMEAMDQIEFDSTGLNAAVIEPGDSIVTAIDRFHGNSGEYNTYADMGLVVLREDEPDIYFKNKDGINKSGLLGELVQLNPGDKIAWGKVSDVALKVRGSEGEWLTVTGQRLDCSPSTGACMEQLQAYGGDLNEPITFYYQDGKTDNWMANVKGENYSDTNLALQAAQNPTQ